MSLIFASYETHLENSYWKFYICEYKWDWVGGVQQIQNNDEQIRPTQ